MSSMRATPPFHPPTEEEEAIGQDNAAWTNDKLEGPPSPPSDDQAHQDKLQPIREKVVDAAWERRMAPAAMVRYELCTDLRNGTYLIWRYAAIIIYIKCGHMTHKTHTHKHTQWCSRGLLWSECCRRCCRQPPVVLPRQRIPHSSHLHSRFHVSCYPLQALLLPHEDAGKPNKLQLVSCCVSQKQSQGFLKE